jgi:pyrimidine-specific ribonucleoside hydrolase
MIGVPTVFDCDPGWDDALALALALAAPQIDLAAITTIYGNATVAETTRNASRVLGVLGQPSPRIYQGSAGPIGGAPGEFPRVPAVFKSQALEALPEAKSGTFQHGAELIVQTARQYGQRLTIIATGPLTNIAIAISNDLEAMSRIGRLIILGGALSTGNITNFAEFNFFCDPEAAKTTLRAHIPKVIIPLETCAQLPIAQSLVDRLKQSAKPFASLIAKVLTERLSFEQGAKPVPLYDVLATLYALKPDIFTIVYGRADVETEGGRRGALSFVPNAAVGELTAVATSVQAQAAYVLVTSAANGQS